MKIIIASGGTAGHIFPAIFTAEEFRRQGHDVLLTGVFKEYREQIEQRGFRIIELPAIGLCCVNLRTLTQSLGAMTRAFVRSCQIVGQERPDGIMGFGAYGAFAIVLAAACRGKPTLIHEQNVRPGKANRLLAWVAGKIAVSFEESLPFFPRNRTVVSGYPCRPLTLNSNPQDSLDSFGLAAGKFTILVVGGSQGSHRINMAFLDAVEVLARGGNLQVIHVTGQQDYGLLQARYRESGVPFYLTPFLHQMSQAYALADLVICRAGGGTITELAAFGVPAILIPYPYAGGHQQENALVLVKRVAAVLVSENDLTPDHLRQEIMSFQKKPWSRAALQAKGADVYRADAALRLVQEMVELTRR